MAKKKKTTKQCGNFPLRSNTDWIADALIVAVQEQMQATVEFKFDLKFDIKRSQNVCNKVFTYQPDWWWCWQMCTVVNTGFGQTLHWQLVFQRCIACEPEGRWCRLGCRSVRAGVEQTGRCLHSGCRVHAHSHSSCIWCCRPRHLGHHFPVVGSTLVLKKSHLLSRWHFVELMEWLDDKKKLLL